MARTTRRSVNSRSEIEYPESDGQPIAETGIHVEVILGLFDMLRRYYRGDPDVAVLANMFLYYVEGDPSRCVCPDVFVIRGVPANPYRPTYKVWEEGKGPDVVIEATSEQTRDADLKDKFEIYRDVLRVQEYFLFDPDCEYLEPSLQGHRLVGRRYVPITAVAGRLPSKVLGLHLERNGLALRLYNPTTGRWIPTYEELAQELREIQAQDWLPTTLALEQELRKNQAERRRIEAHTRAIQAEIQRLRRELEKLKKKSKSS